MEGIKLVSGHYAGIADMTVDSFNEVRLKARIPVIL